MNILQNIYNLKTTCDMNGLKSDKNTSHSYIDVYDEIFSSFRDITYSFLEIGIKCGGSIPLWHEYFYNATIYAMDKNIDMGEADAFSCTVKDVENFCKKFDRVKYIPNLDAYTLESVQSIFQLTNEIGLDIIIDDGSHILTDQGFVIVEYGKILKPGGIIVIEDVQNIDHFEILKNMPVSYEYTSFTADLRHKKNRYDDLLYVLQKSY